MYVNIPHLGETLYLKSLQRFKKDKINRLLNPKYQSMNMMLTEYVIECWDS